MTTVLTRRVRRRVHTSSGLDLVLGMEPEGLTLREHGRRKTFGPLKWGSLFMRAVDQDITQRRRNRRRRSR